MTDKYPSLHLPVRVYADGEVQADAALVIRHRARDGQRVVAAPPMRAHNERRYAGLSSIPAGINQEATLPNYRKQVADE